MTNAVRALLLDGSPAISFLTFRPLSKPFLRALPSILGISSPRERRKGSASASILPSS